jgi:hypothetical protein
MITVLSRLQVYRTNNLKTFPKRLKKYVANTILTGKASFILEQTSLDDKQIKHLTVMLTHLFDSLLMKVKSVEMTGWGNSANQTKE